MYMSVRLSVCMYVCACMYVCVCMYVRMSASVVGYVSVHALPPSWVFRSQSCQAAAASSILVYSEREGGGVVALPLISTLSDEGDAAAAATQPKSSFKIFKIFQVFPPAASSCLRAHRRRFLPMPAMCRRWSC